MLIELIDAKIRKLIVDGPAYDSNGRREDLEELSVLTKLYSVAIAGQCNCNYSEPGVLELFSFLNDKTQDGKRDYSSGL